MNYLVILFAVTFCVSEAKVNFNIYGSECFNELNGDSEYLVKTSNNAFFPEYDKGFKDLLVCAWKREGIISENEEMDMQNFMKFLVDNIRRAHGSNHMLATIAAADLMHHCQYVRGATIGDTAVFIANCVLRRIEAYDTDDNVIVY